MKQQKLVSIVMNGYNSEIFVFNAIESVIKQTYHNWELIFWDNCSNDDTAKIVKKFKDSRIKYFLSNKLIPLGEARNLALEKSKGEFIAFLDTDDLWLPNKLEFQIPLFNNPAVGIVYSNSLFFNVKGNTRKSFNKTLPGKGHCFKKLLGKYFLSLETVVIRKTALEEQNEWFDSRYNMIEDADLLRRIAYKWEIDGIPEVLAKWRVHANSVTHTKTFLLRNESNLMIDKFKEIYPNFEKNFKKEIEELFNIITQYEARNFWIKGKKWPLVKYLFKQKSIKFILFGIIVFLLPTFFTQFIFKIRGDVFPYPY